MTATIKFASYFWDRKRMSQDSTSLQALLTESSEDDQKLQDDLDIMLSSLNIHEMTKETDAFTLQEALHGLIEKIQQATRQTLDNQIVDPSSRLQRQLDVASLGGLVDRMNKRRLVDQEWVSNSEQLKRDINELVAKSSCFFTVHDDYEEQRFELSPIKERDLYLFQIFSKIDRQTSRRMTNQDAKPKRNFEEDELFSIIHKMQQSNRFTDQRAAPQRKL
ncbi:hypothetical protein INT47_010535 [Mucor saturninus]|uniref:Uncharacterized protein n=1 Tax=Mucor saturninus TaxID=64648 RepID=A0A8H7QU08_9FUNG|nr:hypothetical protein INT47_010535 [Mucor saturninus]